MPRKALSGTRGLYKKHTAGCPNVKGRPTDCNCPWWAGYRRIYESLTRWSATDVDPRQVRPAQKVFTRLKAAIDSKTYSREGERRSLGSGQRFTDFVTEWKTHYKEEYNLTANSLDSMLGVLTTQFGTCTLEYLSGASTEIERWLNRMAKERHWTDNTWLRYYELLNALFGQARRWTANNTSRMRVNPMEGIMRRVGTKRRFTTRFEEEVEDKLLAACADLNRPQHQPRSKRLTWEKVDQIRAAVADGESQNSVAERFSISSGLCCQIVKRDIWNPESYKIGTKGDEMRLRVLAAFRTGLRRGEMLDVQLKHVQFRPLSITIEGKEYKVLTINCRPRSRRAGRQRANSNTSTSPMRN
jgi:integrase